MERMIKIMYVIAFTCLIVGIPVAMYLDAKVGATTQPLHIPRHPW